MNKMQEQILEFGKGSIIGIGQVAVGHPFDTMKVIIQSGGKTALNPHTYLRGIRYPMMLSTFSNAGLFGIFSVCNNNNINTFNSGLIAGSIMSLIMNPFEFWKVQAQHNEYQYKLNKKKSFNEKVKLSYSGMIYMTPRESIGNAIYFSTYFNVNESMNLHPFISGGIAGCCSWTLTYSLDTLKTRKQSHPEWTFKQCLNYGPLYKGLLICLCRAFLANGVSFVLYDCLH